MATYRIQIADEPSRIITLKIRQTLLILLPVKYAAELIVEFRRGPVEAMELLQGWVTGWTHGGYRYLVRWAARRCGRMKGKPRLIHEERSIDEC